MTDITIPDGAVEAAAKERWVAMGKLSPDIQWPAWEDVELAWREDMLILERAALRAGLAAWQGMKVQPGTDAVPYEWHGTPAALILPLPQEKQP